MVVFVLIYSILGIGLEFLLFKLEIELSCFGFSNRQIELLFFDFCYSPSNFSFLSFAESISCAHADLLKQVFAKIVESLASATSCNEFSHACKPFIDEGVAPPPMVDHWIHQQRNSDRDFNRHFGSNLKKMLLTSHIGKDPTLLCIPPKLNTHIEDMAKSFSNNFSEWNLENEISNEGNFEDYFPGVRHDVDNCFWALFTNLGFCEKTLRREKKFSLYLHCQPTVNNRDIELAWVNERSGRNQSPLEYLTQLTDASKNARHDEMEQSDAHHILLCRQPRDSVENHYLLRSLACHHHMWEKASTAGDKEDRSTGLKIAGDQVGVIATENAAFELFEALTVSKGQIGNWISDFSSSDC